MIDVVCFPARRVLTRCASHLVELQMGDVRLDASRASGRGDIFNLSQPQKNEPRDLRKMKGPTKSPMRNTTPAEAKADLREFLKVVCPSWSFYTLNKGQTIDRVMAKLEDIGVRDCWELMRRVQLNTINIELSAAGHTGFTEDTMKRLRHNSNFLKALEHLREPHYRQSGVFAPVPQLLSSTHFDWRDALDSCQQRPTTPDTQPGKSAVSAKVHGATRPGTAPEHKGSSGGRRGFGDGSWNSGSNAGPVNPPQRKPKRVSSAGASRPPAGQRASSQPSPNRAETLGSEEFDLDSALFSRPSLRFVTRPSTSERSLSGRQAQPSVASGDSDGGAMLRVLSSAQRGAGRGSLRVAAHFLPSAEQFVSRAAHAGATPSAMAPQKRERSELPSGEIADGFGPRFTRIGGFEDLEIAALEASPAVLEARLEKIQQAGKAMTSKPREAAWTNSHIDNIQGRAEAMLSEQIALDEKDTLLTAMRREGPKSLTRQLICTNIENRLKAAAGREAKAKSDVHSQCTSISDNLASMQNSRHELHKVRKYAHVFMSDGRGESSFANAVRRRYTRGPTRGKGTTRLV